MSWLEECAGIQGAAAERQAQCSRSPGRLSAAPTVLCVPRCAQIGRMEMGN